MIGYYEEPEKTSTFNFIGLSSMLHVAAFAATLLLNLAAQNEVKKPQIIEIEFVAAKGAPAQSLSSGSLQQQAGAPAAAPAVAESISKTDVIVKKVTAKKSIAKKMIPIKKSFSAKKIARSSKSSHSTKSVAHSQFVPNLEFKKVQFETAETNEPAPEVPVDDGSLLTTELAGDLSEDKIGESINAVNNSDPGADVENLVSEIGNSYEKDLQEGESLVNEEVGSIESAAAQSVANARAKGSAYRQGLIAARAAQMKAMAAAQGAGGGQGGSREGRARGIPNGVRKLGDLRQVPGNKKPTYSLEDRMKLRQGEVVFYAYISKAGVPTEFKMIRSTGHQTLDSRTLGALKQWKFYPGQEGWVELPFSWSLKGSSVTASAK